MSKAKPGASAEFKRTVVIRNAHGLHTRPAAVFVQAASQYKACEIMVSGPSDEVVNGKSIMGLLMLSAAPGTELVIEAQGEGAEQALDELSAIVKNRFGLE